MWDPPPDRRLTARRAARLATEMQAAPVQLIFLPGASERPGSPVLSSGGALRPKAKSQEGYSLGESSSHASGLARPWKSSSTVHRGEDTERDSDARLAGGLAGTPSELITAGWKLQHARCGWDPAASALAQPQPRRARSGLSAGPCCPPASFHSQWRRVWCQGKTERWGSKPRPAHAPSESRRPGLLPTRGSGCLEGHRIFERPANEHRHRGEVGPPRCLSLNYVRSVQISDLGPVDRHSLLRHSP